MGGIKMTTLHKESVVKDQDPHHILVMEDDVNVARGLEMVLTEEGYAVNLAGTGALALEAFKQKRYDLLVADLRLPDMDGMEVIKKVKSEKPETEVIVITGHGTTATAVKAMKLGARDFLPKPFTEEQIKSSIDDVLKEQHAAGTDEIPSLGTEEVERKLIQKREVIQALNRTAEDGNFWRDLMETGTTALESYNLSNEARAAIASGDLKWINENVGELTQKQLMFIYKRLEREAW
jgi:DNA-binding response OmpR family regulator